jgi:exosortase
MSGKAKGAPLEGTAMMEGDALAHDVGTISLRDPTRARVRTACFVLLVGLTLAVFWAPLGTLIRFSFLKEEYSHILLLPLVSAALFVLERRRIFSHLETSWGVGSGLLFAAVLFYWFGRKLAAAASQNDQLAIAMFSVVTIWVGCFVLCYGLRAFRAGLFPVLFLFWMVPIPDFLLDRVIFWLQAASAEVSYAVFLLVGVPIFRTGFVFELPGVSIEVARECSGIRSSLAMLITSLLAGHLFLRSGWTKAVLALATLPLLVVKNGIRIVTLTLLSIYVDPGFLTGRLHRSGGMLFFLIALIILVPVLRLLQKSEGPRPVVGILGR